MAVSQHPPFSSKDLKSQQAQDAPSLELIRKSRSTKFSGDNPWISKKQIARKFDATIAEIEFLVSEGYLHPIRRAQGGFYRKNQRVFYEYYLADVIAGISAYRQKASPPAPTDPVSTRQKNPWEA